MANDATVSAIEFFFDPTCPWTWRTSRWVRRVAASRGLDIRWRPFSLKLNASDPSQIPEQYRAGAEMGFVALRLVAKLDDADDRSAIDRYYSALGEHVHVAGNAPGPHVAKAVAGELGLDTAVLDDDSLDATLRASREEALRLVGDDVGSPILALTFADGVRRAFFGPVVAGPTTGDLPAGDDDRIWEGVVTLARADSFSELKRARKQQRAS